MSGKMYYSIHQKKDCYELHISNDKEKARNAESLSRSIEVDSPDVEMTMDSWYRFIDEREMIAIG